MLPGTTDVFIIGGGPAGLATAIAARRRGYHVIVADCATPPIDKACGEGIMPDGLDAAQALGIDLSAMPARPFAGIQFLDSGASVTARFPRGQGLGIRRTALHHHLATLAADAGVRLAWGTPVSGITADSVLAAGQRITARWIVGADGGHSRVRQWAGLDASHHHGRRYGFRTHLRMRPWNDFMELHWGDGCQLYITPVADDEVCIALLSRDPHLRLRQALDRFPSVARHIGPLDAACSPELGGVSATRRLRSVWHGNVALIGDASGSVDAITGKGMCLLFQQAAALAAAWDAGDLALYQRAHRRIGRMPELMARAMLLLDRGNRLRRGVIQTMAWQPRLFAGMLAAHVGQTPRLLTL